MKLIAFAGLILLSGFGKEGLASDSLVRLGVLSGSYTDYKYLNYS